jgi:hypothetical protein
VPPLVEAGLSNDQLVDLGATLEIERAQIRLSLNLIIAASNPGTGKPLLKPGIKLGINSALIIAGLSLAPVTLNISLALTVIGAAMTSWDGVDFINDARTSTSQRRKVARLRRRAAEVEDTLLEIDALLSKRLTEP